MTATSPRRVELDVRVPVWDRFFTVAPLVLVGTREPDGRFDLAPKHMVLPLGWQNYFGFVCTPRHATYFNAWRERAFTVSFPRPDQLVETSLAASGRCDDGTKPAVATLATVPARRVNGAPRKTSARWTRPTPSCGSNGLKTASSAWKTACVSPSAAGVRRRARSRLQRC